ncbi:SDR family NAD(P)-dependent oxidoreductase [Amnibacterium sp. CER49]|uniref:SDR family NAD(P)-dependent oxidoreductase n=1 Tax=Amnibacterium sp. CER49 TaxID=3039161 RepID=UPI00244BA3F4|nr:SDR family NAD(P)-dependent oxidoreductase [Amnibacterium sp. CER49]MDH2443566.1 SDR family NAD(P)-dependent oxidoreductase [Amnibacterium sp. CER49]
MSGDTGGLDLAGRRGVITGGGRGIGRAIALRLAERGGDLLLVGRDRGTLEATAEDLRAAGGTARALSVDLTDPAAPVRVVEAALEGGGLDLLVNNAGNVRAGRLDAIGADDVRAMVDLNLTAAILTTQAALPALRAADRGGVVLSISSGIGLVPLPFYSVYAATKTGLAGFGHALRRELAGTRVHVATAYPGATDTDMMTSSRAGESLGFGRRPVDDVVDDLLAALERGEHEINTSLPTRRRMQELHRDDPLAVDAALAPRLAEMEEAVRGHSSIAPLPGGAGPRSRA